MLSLERLLPRGGYPKRSFLTSAPFRAAIDRERMRADRAGGVFSIVSFHFARRRDFIAAAPALLRLFQERLRATDEIGMLGRRQVGLLLPDTSAAGSWKLAGDLRAVPDSPLATCVLQVFEYPGESSDLFDSAAASRDGTQLTAPRAESPRPADGNLGCEATMLRSAPVSPSHGRRRATAARRGAIVPSHHARPVADLLVRRLPLWKRGLDLLVASAALVVLAPLMLLAAVAVKLSSPGPVLFAQRRDGLGGKPFVMYKFRTMFIDAETRKAELAVLNEQDGPAFKIARDPRVTPIGRLLRQSCLDELPQLWNVVRGEMSLVGPRPLPCDESRGCSPWQRRRLDVTPGMTCIWQIEGGTHVSFAQWMRMDLRYIRRRALAQDLKLLLRTPFAVLLRKVLG